VSPEGGREATGEKVDGHLFLGYQGTSTTVGRAKLQTPYGKKTGPVFVSSVNLFDHEAPVQKSFILLVSRRMLQEWALKVQEKQALTEPFARGWE
jgi:hypothetical protein